MCNHVVRAVMGNGVFKVAEDSIARELFVSDWRDRGFMHGFCNKRTDVMEGVDVWQRTFADTYLCLLEQKHSSVIRAFPGADWERALLAKKRLFGDGWFGSLKELPASFAVGVRTADCIPVIMWSEVSKTAAVLHCGWRGVLAGIVIQALSAFNFANVAPSTIEVAIGPGVSVGQYQVGREVVEALENASANSVWFCNEVLSIAEKGMHFDLKSLIAYQMKRGGVPKETVFLSEICTIESAEYFSYRRESGMCGRQVTFISGRNM